MVRPVEVLNDARSESLRIAKRYDRLGMLGRGATGAVYRAHDRLHARQVALKTVVDDVHDPDDPLSSEPVRASGLLAREFVLLVGLRHPNIVSCMEYAHDAATRPFFTMDLQSDARPLRDAARGVSSAAKVDLLVQILHALAYVHRRGLVHRDVKPENLLTTNGVVKLIDFGLAVPAGTKTEGGAGTLAYCAPEIIRGGPASPAADLFAVGAIGYEILVGRHPFDVRSRTTLLQSLFRGEPDWSSIEPRMVSVLRKLLARDPAQRFDSALDVVAALTEAAARSLPLETVSTREAFLQGTELVGREAELARLRAVVPCNRDAGTALVVAGESGVGKSRLLEELAVDAMVRGARVLRGQSLHTGGRPYEPWRAVFRGLLLLAAPTPFEASVVAGVVSDAGAILEQHVDPAPELDPEATHVRLVRVLEALLRRSSEPLLVLLEDMQWAGAESLALFARVRALASSLPISFVASFRTQDGSAMPEELARVETIALERLSASAVARLCETTIGASRVADVVWDRSHGNAFAVLEVVRTLADAAGGLERVGALDAPERLFEGQVERLLDRRVERLSERDRALLRTAAVAGRELELDLLAAIHPDTDVGACAERGVEAAVLASVQGRWWFAHDKLRDAMIDALPDAERTRIHGEVARALAKIAPDDAPRLAYHFRAAGDVEPERVHAARAGEQFLRSGAYREAIPHLRRALALHVEAAPIARARLHRQLGESLFRCGKLIEAKESLASALAVLGRPLPASKLQLGRAMLTEGGAQLALRARRQAPRAEGAEHFEEMILAYTQLSRLAHHLNDEPLVLYVTLCALNLAERGRLVAHHARLAAVFGAVMGLLPVHAWARFYFGVARALGERTADPTLRAFILAHQGYYEAGIGAWQACRDHLEESIELYDRIGDVRLGEESISILAYALFFEGESARSLELYDKLARSGEERGDQQIRSWGLTNRLKLLVRMGRLAEIDDAMLSRAEALLVDGITRAVHDGVRIDLALARKDLVAARREAEQAVARLKASAPRSFMACSTYASIAEALLACASEDAALVSAAARATKSLAAIARVFPITKPASRKHARELEALRKRLTRA